MPPKPKPKFKDTQKVKGRVLKRARRRAKKLGMADTLKGGVTGTEARQIRTRYQRNRPNRPNKPAKRGTKGGIRGRALDRIEYLKEHGGVPGGVRAKGGISRQEARKLRGAYMKEKRFDPLAPRSGRGILKEAEALAALEYGPQEREFANQRQNEMGRQNVLYGPGGWFEGYQQQVGQIAANQAAVQQAFQAGANQAAQAQLANSQQQLQQDQAQVATPVAGGISPDVQAQAQQAAQGRQAQQQNFGTTLASIGAANQGLMGSMQTAATQQGMEGLRESQSRVSALEKEVAGLKRERGAYKVGKVGELKGAEREWSAVRKEFGLKEKEQRGTRAQQKEETKTERLKARSQVQIAETYTAGNLAKARAQIKTALIQAGTGNKKAKAQIRTALIQAGASEKKANAMIRQAEIQASAKGKGGGGGQWGGPVDTPVEKQKSDQMYTDLLKHKPKAGSRQKVIQGAIRNGVPRSAAVKAWNRYRKRSRSVVRSGQAGLEAGRNLF